MKIFGKRSLTKDIAVVATCFFIMLFTIWSYWETSYLVATVFFLLALVQFAHFQSRKLILIYILCLIFPPIVEAISIEIGIWEYAQPDFLNIPVFLPFFWGLAGLLCVHAIKATRLILNRRIIPFDKVPRVASVLVVTSCSLIALWTLWDRPHTLFLALFALLVLEVAYLRNFGLIFIFAIAGLFGPLIEYSCVSIGVWSYAQPTLGLIPIFIIGLWGGFGTFIASIHRILGTREFNASKNT